MVRMKLSKEEFDPKALDVKVEPSTFKRYRGEIPPNNTILIFRVTKMWWTQSNAGDSQIRLMAFAEQNKGSLAKYNGLPVREYLTFNPDSAFRYMSFLNNFGLTTRDIYNKMDVEPEPDQIGDIINSIADWVVGGEDALCRCALVRDHYNPDELRAKVDLDGWMPLDDDDIIEEDDEEDEEEEPAARPTRGSGKTSRTRASASARSRDVPDEDEDDDEEEDDIDDEEEDEAAEEEQDEEEPEDEEEEQPATTSRRSRNAGRTTARTRPAARSSSTRSGTSARASDGSRTRSGSTTRESSRAKRIKEDEPPF